MKLITTIITFLISQNLAAPANGVLQSVNSSGGTDPLSGDQIEQSTNHVTNLKGSSGVVTTLIDDLVSKKTN